MTSPKEKVDELVTSGRIRPEEGERLLRALEHAPPPPRWTKMLWSPFERLNTAMGLGIGVAVALGQLGMSFARVRFDGALDVHRGGGSPSLALLEQLVAWPLTATLVWLASLPYNRRARWIDYAVAVGVARATLVLVAAFAVLVLPASMPQPDQISVAQSARLMLGVLILPVLAWFFVLLFQGVKTASGLTGVRLWVSFLGGVLLAEVASKVVLGYCA